MSRTIETTNRDERPPTVENKIPDEAVNVLAKATAALRRLVKRHK